jgi:hypothetical protein
MDTEQIIRPQVEWFAAQMEQTLRQNDHKGGWEESPLWYLLERLKEETIELEVALERVELSDTQTSMEHAIRESTDIANFAMMIADKLRKRIAMIEEKE